MLLQLLVDYTFYYSTTSLLLIIIIIIIIIIGYSLDRKAASEVGWSLNKSRVKAAEGICHKIAYHRAQSVRIQKQLLMWRTYERSLDKQM